MNHDIDYYFQKSDYIIGNLLAVVYAALEYFDGIDKAVAILVGISVACFNFVRAWKYFNDERQRRKKK